MAIGRAMSCAGGMLLVVLMITAAGVAQARLAVSEELSALEAQVLTSQERRIKKLIEAKELDQALKEVDALEKRQPRDASVANLKGTVYLARGDFANARTSFERAMALKPDSIAAAMNLAQIDLTQNKPDAARGRFNAVLAVSPGNAMAMLGLAAIASAVGQDADYVSWLEKATQADPKLTRPRVLLMQHYLAKKDARRALSIARDAKDAIPDDPAVLGAVGTVQLAAGEANDAVNTFSALVRMRPNDASARYQLATAWVAVGNYSSAGLELDRAIVIKPDYIDAKVLLATIALDARRYDEALRLARDIEKLKPKSAAGLTLQGDALMGQRQYAAALKAYEAAFAASKSGIIAVKVHEALVANGKPREAEAGLLRWLKEHPTEIGPRAYLGATYVRAHDYKKAIEQYQLIIANEPDNARAHNDLAWLYQREKDPRALATAERAYKLNPDVADTMDTLGWILVEQGNVERGLDLLKKAAEKAPTSTTIQYHRAVALAKSGDKARARKGLEDLLATKRDFPERAESEALLKQL